MDELICGKSFPRWWIDDKFGHNCWLSKHHIPSAALLWSVEGVALGITTDLEQYLTMEALKYRRR